MKRLALIINICVLGALVFGCEVQVPGVEGTLWYESGETFDAQNQVFPSAVYKFDAEGILRYRKNSKQTTGVWQQSEESVSFELEGKTFEGVYSGEVLSFGEELILEKVD